MAKFNIGDLVLVTGYTCKDQAGGIIRGDYGKAYVGKVFEISSYWSNARREAPRFTEASRIKHNIREDYVWDERLLRRYRKAKVVVAKAQPIPVQMQEEKKEVLDPDLTVFRTLLSDKVRTNAGTCSYAIKFTDGSIKYQVRDACHARIPNSSWGCGEYFKKTPMAIALNVKGHSGCFKDITTYRKYVNYILNDSPWKEVFLTRDVDEAFKYGVLMNVEKNIHAIVAGAVALREGSEFAYETTIFEELLDNGISGNTAYVLSKNFKKNGNDNYQLVGISNAHKVLAYSMDRAVTLEFFKNGYAGKADKDPYRLVHNSYRGLASFIAPMSKDAFGDYVRDIFELAKAKAEVYDWYAPLPVVRVFKFDDLYQGALKMEPSLNNLKG